MDEDFDFGGNAAEFDLFDDGEQQAGGDDFGETQHANTHNVIGPDDAELIQSVPPAVDVLATFPKSDDCATPRIVNTICLMSIGRHVDLRVLACAARNVELNPSRRAAVVRLREPACAALIRTSGATTILGCTSVAAAKRASVIIARIVRSVFDWGPSLKTIQFDVRSLTVRFDLKHPVRLEALYRTRQDICAYEPETFCGCHVKLRGICDGKQWAVCAAVFVSGKINLSGAKSMAEVQYAYDALLPLVAATAKGANPAVFKEVEPAAEATDAAPALEDAVL